MLVLDRITVDIQNSRILRAVSLRVAAGELVCLVGRNGAGKTTTLRTIMGYLQPAAGGIEFRGSSLARMRTDRIAQLGIGYAPEESQVFGDLTGRVELRILLEQPAVDVAHVFGVRLELITQGRAAVEAL